MFFHEQPSADEDEVKGTASSHVMSADDIDDADYDEEELALTANRLAMGSCVYDGKTYMSAQQIPRNNSCDFCFCFRSDIICLQVSRRGVPGSKPGLSVNR